MWTFPITVLNGRLLLVQDASKIYDEVFYDDVRKSFLWWDSLDRIPNGPKLPKTANIDIPGISNLFSFQKYQTDFSHLCLNHQFLHWKYLFCKSLVPIFKKTLIGWNWHCFHIAMILRFQTRFVPRETADFLPSRSQSIVFTCIFLQKYVGCDSFLYWKAEGLNLREFTICIGLPRNLNLPFSKTTGWISFIEVSINNFLYVEGYSINTYSIKMFLTLEAW